MKVNKGGMAVKQALICILIMYAVFTAVPAAIYIYAEKNGGQKTDTDITASTVNSAEQSEKAPASTTEPEATAAPTERPQHGNSESVGSSAPPEFLDGMTYISGLLPKKLEDKGFRILNLADNTVLHVSERDFLIAAVACEMPLSAPVEALRAQTVAAHSFYIRERDQGGSETADFSCNTESWLIYTNTEAMKQKWGENFQENYDRLSAVVDSVYDRLLVENGQAICATYFAISNGSTESSYNVWGDDLAYLQTVASPGDELSDGYLSIKKYNSDSLMELLSAALPDAGFDYSMAPENWFQNQQLSPAGYTTAVDVCGVNVTGPQIRTALSLSSSCMEISYEAPHFIFTVRGRGHGVGMSQTGAMFMAEQGCDYREILEHYYSGAELI